MRQFVGGFCSFIRRTEAKWANFDVLMPNQAQQPSKSSMRIRAFPTNVDDSYIVNTFEELYRNAYTMVLHKHGDKLYEGLKEVVREHLQTRIRDVVVESINGRFLEVLNRVWTDHTTSMVMIRDILMYLDRVYVSQANVESVHPLGLRIFREEVVDYPVINEHLKATLLGMISLERQKEIIEWIDLKNDLFLRETADFYRRASQKFLAENSACVYVHKVNESLIEEVQRSERYLDKITEAKIIDVLNDELISRNMTTIVEMENSGLVYMLLNDRIDDLRCLYELLKRVPNGPKTMTNTMSSFLRAKGTAIVNDNTQQQQQQQQGEVAEGIGGVPNPINFIQSLIGLKEQFDRFLLEAFNNDRDFKHCIQSDFEQFLNLSLKAPEYLSLYIDDKLKKGLRTLNESEVEVVLDKALVLFRFLQEKDMFEKYYKQHLAKRLLLQKSLSDDAEKSMISKLKTECGIQFTSKIEGMFRDMELSSTIMNDYRSRTDLDLAVRVLTSVFWPTNQAPMCTLPQSAEQAFRHFEQFYLGKHNGRKITLNPGLGSADVKAIFYPNGPSKSSGLTSDAGLGSNEEDLESQQESDMPGSSSSKSTVVRRREEQKILTVTTYMMCLLMRFNQHARMTYEQLLNETQIPDRELKRCLQSLAMGKQSQRILCRKGAGKDIESLDEFFVNDQFSSKLTRIKIQMVSGRSETEPERKETRAKVDDDRKHEIEAAIVRVMKARKKLLHNDLVTEVTNQLKGRFLPDPVFIKKRVESLIEREYLERDKLNLKIYVYLA
uniref:Cullin family profile domain-containing protein n=1 Tax=Globodera rostochiensis TaxID=31243 RepID=A0A914HNV9_GLORO